VLFASPPQPRVADVRPASEIRTAAPVNGVAVDRGVAATIVGITRSWEYVLVWSPKGVVVRANLTCETQESSVVIADGRLAHVCTDTSGNTVLTASLRKPASIAQLRTTAFASLAGRGTLIAGAAGPVLWRFDPARKTKLRTYSAPVIVFDVDGGRILVGRTNSVLDVVSRSGNNLFTLHVPHVDGALLRGAHVGAIARHRFVLSDLHGHALQSRPVLGDATLLDMEPGLVLYGAGTRLHLLRLRDGRDVGLRFRGQFGYASARFSGGGLFYAYDGSGGSKPGHLGFVTAAGVRALLRG
jgi:hypothetical protein